MALEESFKEIAAWIEKGADRNQINANKAYPQGSKIFVVLLGEGKDGEWPKLYIRAEMPEDAKARYQSLCGINYVKPEPGHMEWSQWHVEDATAKPEAKAAVAMTFMNSQAA